MKYRPEIDGLRAVAVVSVILFHAGVPFLSGGFIGVDVFFVISGYLITTFLIRDLCAGRFSILDFYDRRVRRIMPALFVVILASFTAAWFILLPADLERFSISAIASMTFWSNIFFWTESGYFDSANELKPLLHTWSLGVEEQYYIVFPLLLASLWRFGRTAVLVVVGVIFAASLVLGFGDFGAWSAPEAAFYLLPHRAWELLVGVFAAFYLTRAQPALPGAALSGALSAGGMALIAFAIVSQDERATFPSMYALAATLGVALIILFERKGTWSYMLLANPLFRGIGLVSYSAYLWHQPLFAFARYLHIEASSPMLMGLLSVLTFGLAYLSYRFVETPFRDRRRFGRNQIFAGAGAALTVALSLGAAGFLSEGAPQRYAPRHLAVFRQFEEPGEYVKARFDALRNAKFDAADPRIKLLVIGDSYGQDIVNAVAETELVQRFQISTFHISARCGNLFLKRDFTDLREPSDRALCAGRPGYEDEGLQSRMAEADEIWLVSSWKDWQVENLAESVENIRAATKARLRVMGRKNFGTMSLNQYMHEFEAGNQAMVMTFRSDHLRVNTAMRQSLPADVFIDVSQMMCGAGPTCRNLTEDNVLISYDGNHLTQAGAQLMGKRLMGYLH